MKTGIPVFNGFKLSRTEEFIRDMDINSVQDKFQVRVIHIREAVKVAGQSVSLPFDRRG